MLLAQLNKSLCVPSLFLNHASSLSTAASAAPRIKLPDLPYAYNALEPVISGEIMSLHHGKHHAAYVANYNLFNSKLLEAESSLEGDQRSPSGLKESQRITELLHQIKFNAGGHINHSLFWKMLCPPKDFKPPGGEHGGAIKTEIEKAFGSVEALVSLLSAKTAAIQGSGWGWLAYDPELRRLQILTTSNQDPVSSTGLVPLLGIDVWEHAYYLQYKNARPEYLKHIWQIINWSFVDQLYKEAVGSQK